MIWKRKLRLAKGYVLTFALEVWLAGVLIDFFPFQIDLCERVSGPHFLISTWY